MILLKLAFPKFTQDSLHPVASPSAPKARAPSPPVQVPEIQNRSRRPAYYRYWQSPDPVLIPEPGRINEDFATSSAARLQQAKQILLSWNRWPQTEGEIFAIQIDQDSPKPPGRLNPLAPRAAPESQRWFRAMAEIQRYVTTYTGKLIVVRSVRSRDRIELEELTPDTPLRAAAHPGQIDPAGQASCTGGVCGMAWLRNGIYFYDAKDLGVFNPVDDRQISVARDTNRDGVIDLNESMASEKSHGLAVQIHAGFPGSPRSVGCQTLPPADFQVFRKLIAAAKVARFAYLLMRRPNEASGRYQW